MKLKDKETPEKILPDTYSFFARHKSAILLKMDIETFIAFRFIFRQIPLEASKFFAQAIFSMYFLSGMITFLKPISQIVSDTPEHVANFYKYATERGLQLFEEALKYLKEL